MAHQIVIPRLGWSMEEGTFVGWLKKDGDFVRRGDAIFELEGEKNVQEIESVEAGILHIPKGSPMAGSTVDVGALLGYLLHENESPPDPEIKLLAESNIEKTPKTPARPPDVWPQNLELKLNRLPAPAVPGLSPNKT